MNRENKVSLARTNAKARIAGRNVYAGVYTPTNTVKNHKPKPHRPSRRKTVLFGVWLSPEEKRRLLELAAQTGVDQSKLVRRGLRLLFEAFNRGQLELGFPDTLQGQSSIHVKDAGSKA